MGFDPRMLALAFFQSQGMHAPARIESNGLEEGIDEASGCLRLCISGLLFEKCMEFDIGLHYMPCKG